jgi:hypothetical protein
MGFTKHHACAKTPQQLYQTGMEFLSLQQLVKNIQRQNQIVLSGETDLKDRTFDNIKCLPFSFLQPSHKVDVHWRVLNGRTLKAKILKAMTEVPPMGANVQKASRPRMNMSSQDLHSVVAVNRRNVGKVWVEDWGVHLRGFLPFCIGQNPLPEQYPPSVPHQDLNANLGNARDLSNAQAMSPANE